MVTAGDHCFVRMLSKENGEWLSHQSTQLDLVTEAPYRLLCMNGPHVLMHKSGLFNSSVDKQNI